MTRVVLLFVLVGGCIERQELREQHCAYVAIERHGYRPPDGAYGTWTRGKRCYTRLWNCKRVDEGKLNDGWRPE